jgi:hypothetical protein
MNEALTSIHRSSYRIHRADCGDAGERVSRSRQYSLTPSTPGPMLLSAFFTQSES